MSSVTLQLGFTEILTQTTWR